VLESTDPLDHLSDLNISADSTGIARSGKGGPFIFERDIYVQEGPEATREALAKVLDARPGWRYSSFKAGNFGGRYGTYVGMFKDMGYEVTIFGDYNEPSNSSITETRMATGNEARRAEIKGFLKNLVPDNRR
jgi:hypothetical protein